MHGLDRRLLDRGADGHEVPVGARIRGGDEPSRAERAERELEETLGDDRVRSRHLARGGGLEPAVLAEVDADRPHVEQARQADDGGLERVRERELRGRLVDDGEQVARALELATELVRTLQRAQGLAGPGDERRDRGERALLRHGRRPEHELEHADRRLADREGCDRRVVEVVEPGDARLEHCLGERPDGALVRCAGTGEHLEPLDRAPPDHASRRAGCVGREPRDPLGAPQPRRRLPPGPPRSASAPSRTIRSRSRRRTRARREPPGPPRLAQPPARSRRTGRPRGGARAARRPWPSSRIGTRKMARAPARSTIRRRPGESSLTWSSSWSGGASSTREPSISAASAACPATARTTSSPRSTRRTTARSAEAAARAVSATAWSASSASAPDARRSAAAESAVSAGVRDSTAVKTSRSSEKHTQVVKNRAKSLYTWTYGRACASAEPTNADTCRGAAGRPDGGRPGLPLLSRQAAREDRAPPRHADGARPLLGDPA